LARLLDLPDIEKVDGFVLPKLTKAYFMPILINCRGRLSRLCPLLETKEVFDFNAMSELRQGLLQDDIARRV